MKKMIYAGIFSFALILTCFTGCGADDKNISDLQSSASTLSDQTTAQATTPSSSMEAHDVKFPSEYKKEMGNITFDMDIILPNDFSADNIYNVKAVCQQIDPEFVSSILMSEKETEKSSIDREGMFWQGADYSILSSYKDSFVFVENPQDTVVGSYRNAFNLHYGSEDYNASKYLTNNLFDFASSTDTFDRLIMILNEVGFDLNQEDLAYTCYSLDHKTMEQEETVIEPSTNMPTEKGRKSEWTNADDSYYFAAYQCYHGIRIVTEHEVLPVRLADMEAPVSALFSVNGPQEIRVERIFNFSQADPVNLLPFEDIVLKLQEKYSMILIEEYEYYFDRAELIYLATGTQESGYSLSPVWVFRMEETYHYSTGEAEPPRVRYEVIDAVTGGEKN